MMNISQHGIDALKLFEGFRNKAYQDVVGKWTIGYGHLIYPGDGCVIGDIITPAVATGLLLGDLTIAEACVTNNVIVPLTQPQFDALVSFVFNLGCKNFKSSTLLRKLNQKDYEGAAKEFIRWDKAGGKSVQGLRNRRIAEQKMFSEGLYP